MVGPLYPHIQYPWTQPTIEHQVTIGSRITLTYMHQTTKNGTPFESRGYYEASNIVDTVDYPENLK